MKHKKTLNLSKFVLQYPDKTAKELVSLAKQKGLTLTAKYVYNVRAHDKARKGKPGRTPGSLRRKTLPPLIRFSDLDLDSKHNARHNPADVADLAESVRTGGNMKSIMLGGEGTVKAFKALVLMLGTELSRLLIIEVEDEVSSAIGRPPL